MKTFSDYLQEKNKTLSWASSFSENRPSILSWNSGFAESRNLNLSEEVTVNTEVNGWDSHEDSVRGKKTNSKKAVYDADIHDHEDVKPQKLNRKSVTDYTGVKSEKTPGSSKNINGYLRNKMGDKNSKVLGHSPEAVHKAVKKLSSNFTPENTNRKELTTYAGVPHHIGEKLESSKKGDIHHLTGFTSTSTQRNTAIDFADIKTNSKNPKVHGVRHIIKFHLKPGAGLSVAANSEHPENEMLLHHGARTEYSHTEINTGRSSATRLNSRVYETHIHHVTVHPDHLDLDKHYGSYDHPSS